MESLALSDTLQIDLVGLTIHANGIYAIAAAVLIIVVLVIASRRSPS